MSAATPKADPGVNEFLGHIASLVSHELRTPLAVIVGYAELLELRKDERMRAEAATHIRRAADRLSRMIDDLLAAAALEAGQMIPDPEPVELRAALADVADRVQVGSDPCRIRHAGAAELAVEVDHAHLRQILANVLSVACAATADVEAALGEERSLAVLTLAPVEPPGPSERAAALALSVAQRLSELAGGSLSLEANALTLRLPLAAVGERS